VLHNIALYKFLILFYMYSRYAGEPETIVKHFQKIKSELFHVICLTCLI